jgi:hypothetical protein
VGQANTNTNKQNIENIKLQFDHNIKWNAIHVVYLFFLGKQVYRITFYNKDFLAEVGDYKAIKVY